MSTHGRVVLVFFGLDEDALLLRDARVLVGVVVDQQRPDDAPDDAGHAEEVEDRLPAKTGAGQQARERHAYDCAPRVAWQTDNSDQQRMLSRLSRVLVHPTSLLAVLQL